MSTASLPIDTAALAKAIVHRRQERQWSTQALADRAGLLASEVNAIEDGTAEFAVENVRSIARALAVDAEDLYAAANTSSWVASRGFWRLTTAVVHSTTVAALQRVRCE